MAISLPLSSGNVAPEYAANTINFTRQVHNINGVLTPVFTAILTYERKDYLIVNGEKAGLIITDPTPTPNNQERYGAINLDPTELGVLFTQVPPAGKTAGDIISDMADDLIKADLIKRGILTA